MSKYTMSKEELQLFWTTRKDPKRATNLIAIDGLIRLDINPN